MGALTSKPYSFSGRTWELEYFNTYDISNSRFQPIILQLDKNKVKKITPISHKTEFPWISDKTRFFYETFDKQRITTIYLHTARVSRKLGICGMGLWDYNIIKQNNRYDNLAPYLEDSNIKPFSKLQLWHAIRYKDTFSKYYELPALLIAGKQAHYDFLDYTKNEICKKARIHYKILENSHVPPDLIYQPDMNDLLDKIFEPTAFLVLGSAALIEDPILKNKLIFINKLHGGVLEFFFDITEINLLITGQHKIYAALKQTPNIIIFCLNNLFDIMQKLFCNFVKVKPTGLITGFIFNENPGYVPALFLNYRPFYEKMSSNFQITYLINTCNIQINNKFIHSIYFGTHGAKFLQDLSLIYPLPLPYEHENAFTYTFDGQLVKFNKSFSNITNQIANSTYPKINPQYSNLFSMFFGIIPSTTFISNIYPKTQVYDYLSTDLVTKQSYSLLLKRTSTKTFER